MQNDIIVAHYAQALFSVEGVDLIEIEQELLSICDLFTCNQDIFDFFVAPMISSENKKKMIQKCFVGKVSTIVLNFLLILIEKKRESEIFRIQQKVCSLNDKKIGRVRASITVAKFFSDDVQSKVNEELDHLIKQHAQHFEIKRTSSETSILFNIKIRETILGGVTIRVGDQYLDASVFRYLENWKKRVASHKMEIDRCWLDA